jgi:Predicted AAA-ATPase/PD-(D/E)XK nuclease superfamily
VILIDEYDKPIIDFLEDQKQASDNHQILKEFFSVLKDADPQLAFVLITGVSKFSKVSIFSDLNNLNDITLHPQFATLTGITPEELDHYFEPRIQELSSSSAAIRNDIKAWYNGYSWDGIHFVYNPFSLLRFMDTGVLTNYWFETGTPTFLVKMVRQAGIYHFNEADFVSLLFLSSFEPDNLEYLPLLFQTGYLTFAEVNFTEGWCKLRFPNQEVKASFEQLLLGEFIHRPKEGLPTVLSIRQALLTNDIPNVMAQINASFSSIPAELWRGATELHYHALVHLVFNLLSNYLRSEVHSALGRCDAVAETPSHVYAFEFKLDVSAELALAQIEEKAYLAPYLTDPRIKVAVGVNFSKEKRKIEQFLIKEMT